MLYKRVRVDTIQLQGSLSEVMIYLNETFEYLTDKGFLDLTIVRDEYIDGEDEYYLMGDRPETAEETSIRVKNIAAKKEAQRKKKLEKEAIERLEYEKLKAKFENK